MTKIEYKDHAPFETRVRVKEGVFFHPDTFSHHEMSRIVSQAQILAPSGYEITITSAFDGKHSKNSKHYKGKALDFRTRDFPKNCSVSTWANRLQRRLGDEYFVLVEKTHMHVQWNG